MFEREEGPKEAPLRLLLVASEQAGRQASEGLRSGAQSDPEGSSPAQTSQPSPPVEAAAGGGARRTEGAAGWLWPSGARRRRRAGACWTVRGRRRRGRPFACPPARLSFAAEAMASSSYAHVLDRQPAALLPSRLETSPPGALVESLQAKKNFSVSHLLDLEEAGGELGAAAHPDGGGGGRSLLESPGLTSGSDSQLQDGK